MKKLTFSCLLLACSCSVHQNERLAEWVAPPQKSTELYNQHLANDLMDQSPDSFTFTLKEQPVLTTSKGSFPLYVLKADGIPKGERFLFASFDPLKERTTFHFEFEVLENNDLKIFTSAGEEIASEHPVVLKDLLESQPVDFAIISKKKATCTRTRIVPTPHYISVDHADFSLTVTHRKGTHFLLEGQGMLPQETILIREHSDTQTIQYLVTADEKGHIAQSIDPIVYGRLGGVASITIVRRKAEARIDYSWGGRLEQESQQVSLFHPFLFVANHDLSDTDILALLPVINENLYL